MHHLPSSLKVSQPPASFALAAQSVCLGDYTFGPGILGVAYPVETFKRNMTKHLNTLFPAINDEISDAFAGVSAPLGGYSVCSLSCAEYIPVTDGASLPCICSAQLPITLQVGRPCL
jgi:hypothetical protein